MKVESSALWAFLILTEKQIVSLMNHGYELFYLKLQITACQSNSHVFETSLYYHKHTCKYYIELCIRGLGEFS